MSIHLVPWFFGLPCSGKSTLAHELKSHLERGGHKVVTLDGDELRQGLCQDLGFTIQDRAENLRRAAEMALLLVNQEIVVVCAFVTPTEAHRSVVRDILKERVCLIYLDCPRDVCAERNSRKLDSEGFAKLNRINARDANFDTPIKADVVLQTAQMDIPTCIDIVLKALN